MVNIDGTEYLTCSQVATHFGVARSTAHNWVRHGVLDALDQGPGQMPRYLIPAAALDGFELPSERGPGWKAGRGRKGEE